MGWLMMIPRWGIVTGAMLGLLPFALADQPTSPSRPRVEAALQNIRTLERVGRRGFATVWDGNKYVQCARQDDGGLRCEAAGSLMQPSLAHALTPQRIARLTALGWRLDPSFGNYVQNFPADLPSGQLADKDLQALADGYDADLTGLAVQTAWVTREHCPPRNGPSQNLAGMVNDASVMTATSIHACAYTPEPEAGPSLPVASSGELIGLYGARVSGEIQRLRVNSERRVFAIFETGIAYVQCRPQPSPQVVYCEAQSADSWPALASVLTAERIEQLHAAGFADPGRAPNYWKEYKLDQADDATISRELLTVLHDVYGYTGVPQLKVTTEEPARESGR